MLQIALACRRRPGTALQGYSSCTKPFTPPGPGHALGGGARGYSCRVSILRCIFAMSDDTSSHRTVYTKYTRKGEPTTDETLLFIIPVTHTAHIYMGLTV